MRKAFTLLIALLGFASIAYAGNFSSGSTGADGAFAPISNTVLQLPPNGVFNFTTVNIPSGVTVTFTPNAANTPVYILATNDVTIAGNLNVNGRYSNSSYPGLGGPGGYSGGTGGLQNLNGSVAPGPTGGNGGCYACYGGQGGGGVGGSISVNANVIPVIGGSGGGGGGASVTNVGVGGGGGGGGILIASSGTVNITGSITANGGAGGNITNFAGCSGAGGGGSGGAIKIIANTIVGNGTIQAIGGSGGSASGCSSACNGGSGANGTIRFEFNTITRAAGTSPAYTFSQTPGLVFYPNIPTLSITSIGGAAVPSSPGGLYNAPDVTLPADTTNPVTVGLSATNIPTGTIITVKVIPQFSTSQTSVNSTALSGTLQSSMATASVNLSTTYTNVIFATTTFTVQTAMNYNGEKITQATVVAGMGGGSQVTYITASGKRVPAEKLFASLMK